MLVPEISIDISQSTEGSIIGLPHTLICTATVVIGVSPSLVKVDWKGSSSLSESPRVVIFDQTSAKSHHRLKFARTVTFSPLLGHDVGEYICSLVVTGFDRIGKSDNQIIMANGKYKVSECSYNKVTRPEKAGLIIHLFNLFLSLFIATV